jgi:hypothetical protein
MARNNRGNNREGGDDERLGRMGHGGEADSDSMAGSVGDPLIPMSEQFEDEVTIRATGDHAYVRDDSDRMSEDRESQEREVSDEERLEMFRMAMFQNQLPSLPQLPGWHLCWLTTANPRDSIQGRLRLGYQLLRPEEVPGWEANTLTAGQYAGCIGINEMVAAKLPMRLYEMYMTEAHHNQPLAEEGKLRSTLDVVREAQGKGTQITLEGAMAALGQSPRRAHFEDIHGPRRAPVTG